MSGACTALLTLVEGAGSVLQARAALDVLAHSGVLLPALELLRTPWLGTGWAHDTLLWRATTITGTGDSHEARWTMAKIAINSA